MTLDLRNIDLHQLQVNPSPFPLSEVTSFFLFLEVVNNGDKLTTVTHVIIHHYKSKWSVICKKPNGQAVVPLPGPMQKLPFELEPGKRWTGLIDQSDIKSKFQGGYIYCGILHTATPKPILCKVVL